MNEMIERVARALCAVSLGDADRGKRLWTSMIDAALDDDHA